MPRIKTYKNSKFATAVGFVGYLVGVLGAYALFNDEPVVGVIAIVAGIGIKVLASYISKRKQAKDAAFSRQMHL